MMSTTANSTPEHVLWKAIIILIGAALRIALLTDNRLHPDEALFGTLARLIITGKDPLLAQTQLLVDKPPLFYYTLAAGISISWASELTLRLPGLFASILSIALVMRIGKMLWHSEIATGIAGIIFALSPFAISFAPTAFADPQMLMWWLAAVAAVSGGRWGWAGLLCGCSLAAKQNAIFLVPLVIVLGIGQCAALHSSPRTMIGWLARFAAGLAIAAGLVAVWDVLRHAETGFVAAAVAANNPHRIIRSSELLPRLIGWARWLGYGTGSGWLLGVWVVGLVWLTGIEVRGGGTERARAITLLLIVFAAGYFALQWLVAFPVLDRYMLPLVPILALLIGRLMQHAVARRKFRVATWSTAVLLLTVGMVPGTLRALGSRIPVGGEHGAYDGINLVAAYLSDLPMGTVVYHDSLGWTLSYYLFDAYVVPAPFESPAALERDLTAFRASPDLRYLLLPGWSGHQEILDAVDRAGYRYTAVFETRNRYGNQSFVLYRLAAEP
jgi:4-amino-4-deoxy-L-arabinose transferase-like glycosyltransferase